MTTMIPPTVHSAIKSAAERRLFRVIQDAPESNDWVCLHSLGLAFHEYKRRGEIDFCLVTPSGIFVLEVKGGRVSRRAGMWTFTDRYGKDYTKHESPFAQASTAMFSLQQDIKRRFHAAAPANAMFGFGVLFPDIEFNDVGPEISQEQIFDLRDRRKPFSDYVTRLARYTKSRQQGDSRSLTKKDIDDIIMYLRGDFDLVPPVGAVFDDTRAQLAELTDEQMKVLDAVDAYDRVIVDGAAGSGKTLLAIESARRDARRGKRVALVCFNRQLAVMIDAQFRNEPFPGNITVRSLYGLFHDLVAASSLAEEYSEVKGNAEEQDVFGSILADYAALSAMELPAPPYDVFVIDEAQDVLTKPIVRAISELVKGGVKTGCWRLFLDGNDQACVYGRMEDEVVTGLRNLAQRQPFLTLNCRNTKPIGLQINVITQPINRAFCRADGPPAEFYTYSGDNNLLGRFQQVLHKIKELKFPPGMVSVLFPEVPTASQTIQLQQLEVMRLSENEVPLLGSKELSHYTWTPVSGFKGLENDVIVFVGLRDLEPEWWRAVNYVGMSRARIRLFVIVHETCNKIRELRFSEELGRRLSSRGDFND